jgi:hypothetical protein
MNIMQPPPKRKGSCSRAAGTSHGDDNDDQVEGGLSNDSGGDAATPVADTATSHKNNGEGEGEAVAADTAEESASAFQNKMEHLLGLLQQPAACNNSTSSLSSEVSGTGPRQNRNAVNPDQCQIEAALLSLVPTSTLPTSNNRSTDEQQLPRRKSKRVAATNTNNNNTITHTMDTTNYDDTDDSGSDCDEEALVSATTTTISAATTFKRHKKAPVTIESLNAQEAQLEQEKEKSNSTTSTSLISMLQQNKDLWSQLEDIPLGYQGAKMMVTFGDGKQPHPNAVALVLLGTRRCLQYAIKDARALRRQQRRDFLKARQETSLNMRKDERDKLQAMYFGATAAAANNHNHNSTKRSSTSTSQTQTQSSELLLNQTGTARAGAGDHATADADASSSLSAAPNTSTYNNYSNQTTALATAGSCSADMMFRVCSGYDPLSFDLKSGFEVAQLETLFPEEMNAYRRWERVS